MSNSCLILVWVCEELLISRDSLQFYNWCYEQCIAASKVLKRFILHAKKASFVVENDFIMATYLADRVIVFEGTPSIESTANAPQSLLIGMNLFLPVSCISILRNPTNFRPLINKLESTKDNEQKDAGTFYYLN
ncbi:hypothetical protein MKX03_003988 [Papaver bracteatum]|nr:hypothetical protein MKX03_003988 [Papaver bracteatum]